MIIACLLVFPSGAAEPADLELARTILTARDANRAKFAHWTIRYECTVAKADDLESALAKRWKDDKDDEERWQNPAIGIGFSAFDGKRGRDELLFSLKDLVEKRSRRSGRNFSSYLGNHRQLTDGEATFSDWISVDDEGKSLEHKPHIDPGNDRFHMSLVLPLGLGHLSRHGGDSLATEIQDVLDGKPGHAMTIREGVRLFDRDLIELAFTDASNSPDVNTSRYWVDLEQGGITRKSEQTFHRPEAPESVQFEVQDDIRRVGDAAWFPYRYLTYHETSGIVRDRIITEADFANVPPRSTFHLTFDTPTKVSDLSRLITYPARTVWDLEHLPQPEPRPRQFRRQPSRWARTKNFLAAHGRSIVGIVLIAIPAVMAVRLILKRKHHV
jgi:hypothetical protein